MKTTTNKGGKAGIMAAGSMVGQVKRLNRWRDQFNPLRGLTIARAVSLLEDFPVGRMADLQWSYFFIEQSDPDLFTLVERRVGAIGEMEWGIQQTPKDKRSEDWDDGLAQEQAAALREAWDGIDNVQEAVEHLALATFRGFSHLEKVRNATGAIAHLEVVDQWNVVRDGLRGAWKYNPEAKSTSFDALPEANLMVPEDFIIRMPARHVNRIGFIKFLRSNLGEKDWTSFVEIYGIPSGIVIMPPSVPKGLEADYEAAAKEIAEGGNGALPNGSDYKPNEAPGGTNPFQGFLDYWTQKLVMVGTGGLLTVLTQSGSGTLAGSVHMEAFRTLARAESRRINDLLRGAMDAEVLAREFPGKPVLAFFSLDDASGGQAEQQKFQREVWLGFQKLATPGAMLANLTDLKQLTGEVGLPQDPTYVEPWVPVLTPAGDAVTGEVVRDAAGDIVGGATEEPEEAPKLTEKRGTEKPDLNDPEGDPDDPQAAANAATTKLTQGREDAKALGNRGADGALAAAGLERVCTALATDLQPVRDRLERILAIEDAGIMEGRLRAFLQELPQLGQDVEADPESARAIAELIAAGVANGIAENGESGKQKAEMPSQTGKFGTGKLNA